MTQKEKAEAIKKQLVVINQLLKKPENKLCADCKRTSPTWASVNLGVFVCINCSGCHREIGVHVTKIRSTNLDVWPQDVLDNFKIINNKIANKYWECKLKKFNFKSLHSDNYKLVQFIRDKYENKKWVDPTKKEDPMTLIIKGKIKKYKKLYCEDEDFEEEENENEETEKKTKKKKKSESFEENENSDEEKPKKKKSSKKNKKNKKEEEGDNNEEEEDNNDSNEEEFEEEQDKKIESKSPNIQSPPQQINNIFLNLNPNQNQQNNLNLNFNNNNNNDNNNNPVYSNSDNNLIDIFSVQTQNDKKSEDLINNINNAYISPQPSHSGFTNLYQQMPNNMGLNLQNKNNMQTMGMNNNNNLLNINRVHSTQNMNMNNNIFNQNQMNNNMFNQNQMNNNMNFGMNNNMNFNNNNNNNTNNVKHTYSMSNTNPSFNMDYFNQNMNNNQKNTGSTYNFSKKKVDPFKSLVKFDK